MNIPFTATYTGWLGFEPSYAARLCALKTLFCGAAVGAVCAGIADGFGAAIIFRALKGVLDESNLIWAINHAIGELFVLVRILTRSL